MFIVMLFVCSKQMKSESNSSFNPAGHVMGTAMKGQFMSHSYYHTLGTLSDELDAKWLQPRKGSILSMMSPEGLHCVYKLAIM